MRVKYDGGSLAYDSKCWSLLMYAISFDVRPKPGSHM